MDDNVDGIRSSHSAARELRSDATREAPSDDVDHDAPPDSRDGDLVDDALAAYRAYQQGAELLGAANPHAAVTALERARALEPAKASIREALGRAYFRSGRFGAASAEFTQAIGLDPVNDYALFGLGLSLLRRGDAAGARRNLKLAVAMRPDRCAYRDALTRAVAAGDP